MTGNHRHGYHRKAENEPSEQAESRKCLKCRAPFESAWSGERVCSKCKNTRAWRDSYTVNMSALTG